MIFPGQSIRLEPLKREMLATEISLIIDDLEQTYAGYFNDLAVFHRSYEATPRNPGQKNWPFVGASNVIVPIVQIMADAWVNQVYASIFGHGRRIWTTATENETQERKVKNIARYINRAANGNDFNFRLPVYDQLLEVAIVGSSVLAANWRTDQRWVYAPNPSNRRQPKALPVSFAAGPLIEHVPREMMLWDTNFLIQEAPVVVRELSHPWSFLRDLVAGEANLPKEQKTWDADAILRIRGRGDRHGPSKRVTEEKGLHDQRDEFNPRDLRATHDIREVHLSWPMLNAMGMDDSDLATPGKEKVSTPSPPIVVTLDRTTKEIIRVIAEPYFLPYPTFFDVYYRKRSGRGHSVGIAKKLENMAIAMTTTLNQALDARTRANSIWARTNKKDIMNRPIDPGHPVLARNDDEFSPLNLPTAIFDDMRLMTAVQVIAERQTGLADPVLGRETRSGGHPSPATSTLALLDQASKMSGTAKELLRMQYSRIGETVASFYQQFGLDDKGQLVRTFGPVDAEDIEDWMFPTSPIAGEIQFDLVAMSDSQNPDTEMKRAVLVSQMNTQYWAFVLRASQSLIQVIGQQIPPQLQQVMVQATVQSIQAQTKAHLRFLEAGDVDDIERFVLELGRNEQATAADVERGAGAAREIALARGGPEVVGLAGGAGAAAGNGAAGAPGIGGRLA